MKKSAGLLMYRRSADGALEVLLAHPGGPFWRNKDEGAWTLPKGEYDAPEEPLAAARREFEEETGCSPRPPFLPLGDAVQKSGKHIRAWAFECDFDPAQLRCNTFEMEWPPRSGLRQSFPEVDRVEWLGVAQARVKINPGQVVLLERLSQALKG